MTLQSYIKKREDEFADRFIKARGGHLQFKAKYGEYEAFHRQTIKGVINELIKYLSEVMEAL